MDDVQAIRRLKRGDIGGLEALVTRYQVKAVETAFLVTQDEPLAEDVVQEVFVRIFQRIRSFDEGRAFPALPAAQRGQRRLERRPERREVGAPCRERGGR